jgi:formate/nitrite transporter FocA (FNT family)
MGDNGGDEDEPQAGRPDDQVADAFSRAVEEGAQRLGRDWAGLAATGAVGGIDVAFGVFALLIVEHETGNRLLAALAFGIGFLALTLAGSELFTENFLVPIAAVVARRARPVAILRLWLGTAATNLLAGWALTWLILQGFPALKPVARETARRFVEEGVGGASFASALLGGALITLMTWMERSTTSQPARLLAALATAFLLAAAPLAHVIVASLELFAGIHAGASFGYLTWAATAAWYTLGNIVGGVGLVTVLRLVQVGQSKIREESA